MQSVSHPPRRAFRAPLGLRHRHVQSLLAAWPVRQGLLRHRARGLLAGARREIVDCGDGVRLLGMHTPAPGDSRGLAILLHGWEGSAEATYVLSLGATLHAAGFDVFRLNFRDHGETQALNRELFHSCRIDEVVAAVRATIAAHPAPRTFVIGHSLGGNFALRVAARASAQRIELAKVVETGLWVYREYVLRRWRRSLLAKAACFPELYDFGDLRRFATLTATTEFFVKRYTTFPDLDAYLSGYAVTGAVLSNLRVPTRLIASADDPVIPVADLRDLATSRALEIDVLAHGGHCAFLESYGLASWIDGAVLAEVAG
jgi:uncharacterized protein